MLNNRSKQCKSQTPTRNHQTISKLPHFGVFDKQGDAFLKQLREVYNKENNDPNMHEVKITSYALKVDSQQSKRSPSKTIVNDRNIPTKNIDITASNFNKTVKNIHQLSSTSKFSHLSTEKQKIFHNIKSSSRNSTEKDEPHVNNFLDKYFLGKQESQNNKKMKVTLKDIKKNKKQTHQLQNNILIKSTEQIRKSIPKQIFSSLQNQSLKNQPTMINSISTKVQQDLQKEVIIIKGQKCFNHPQKKASHRLLDDTNQRKTFCQKCSVNLVTKGCQMIQLTEGQNASGLKLNEVKQTRLQRLKMFLLDVDELEPIFRQSKEDLINYKRYIDQKYKLEESRLHLYYRRICQQIQSSYQKTVFNLKIFYNSVIQELDQNQKNVQENYQNIGIIKEDILPNINSIIEEKQINQQAFQKIIQDYHQNLRSIKYKIKQICSSNYSYYEYNYNKNNHLMPEIQKLISLNIVQHSITSVQETKRDTKATLEETTELFRISFGKEVPSPSFKIF